MTYVAIEPDGHRCAIIDPVLDFDSRSGTVALDSLQRVVAWVRERSLSVQWILETHPHGDHLSGAFHLKPMVGGRIGIGRVDVIGGGYGGARAAKYLRLWSERRIEVMLVERNAAFVSCPLSNRILGGSRKIEDLTIGYDALRARGVRIVTGEVTAVDAKKAQMTLGRGAPMTYDRLVVSPGIDFLFDELPGLRNAEARERVPHAWRAGPETVALRRQLEAMPDGGVYVLPIPRAPYRCPPGPYERIRQVAHFFKSAKPRSKIIVLDANPDLVSKKDLFLAAWNELNSMASNHADIAASATVAMMTGQPINPLPTIDNTCYSYVSDREAMHVDSVHRWGASQKTLVPVKDSRGVSSA